MQRGQNVVVDDCWGTGELVKLLLVRTDDSTAAADGGDAPTLPASLISLKGLCSVCSSSFTYPLSKQNSKFLPSRMNPDAKIEEHSSTAAAGVIFVYSAPLGIRQIHV
jgi:hypothetical protein